MSDPELSMGPFCVTRFNPAHQLIDSTQPNPLQVGKFGPNPTQPNTTNNLTAWCNQILSDRAEHALLMPPIIYHCDRRPEFIPRRKHTELQVRIG